MATDTISVTATGASKAHPVDLARFRGGVGLIATLSDGGAADYDVEVTGDHRSTTFTNWNKHDILKAKTASANGNIAFPVSGVRLYVRSLSGTLTLSIVYVEG